ncbi:lysosomal-trafficking regulator isoform X3 [Macrobrachium rosenbergii]|uniref:lysosomal-trafficking regulator isoform X3 n=1 Tax=Macrobrachium rosenbergii TaxID=79674 RepID=UPI0034D4C994
MSDQRLQETWTSFAQTQSTDVLERQTRLDEFLELLLSSAKGETPISNLIHFSDVESVINLLSAQFLADIEHICLGSASYESDVSSSATSRSVESIVSDGSQASDFGKGCRPRVTGKQLGRRTVSLRETSKSPCAQHEQFMKNQADLQQCYDNFNREYAKLALKNEGDIIEGNDGSSHSSALQNDTESIQNHCSQSTQMENEEKDNSVSYFSGSDVIMTVNPVYKVDHDSAEIGNNSLHCQSSSSNAPRSADIPVKFNIGAHSFPKSVPMNNVGANSDIVRKTNCSAPDLASIVSGSDGSKADVTGVARKINLSAPDLDLVHKLNGDVPNLNSSTKVNTSAPDLDIHQNTTFNTHYVPNIDKKINSSAPNSLNYMRENDVILESLKVDVRSSDVFSNNLGTSDTLYLKSKSLDEDCTDSHGVRKSDGSEALPLDILCKSNGVPSNIVGTCFEELKAELTKDNGSCDSVAQDNVAPGSPDVIQHESELDKSKSDCVPIDALPAHKKVRHQSAGSMPHSSPRSRQLSGALSLTQDDGLDTIALKQYVLRGCGAKILVALDQLGVASITGIKEISHVLGFVFRYIFKNASAEEKCKFWYEHQKDSTLPIKKKPFEDAAKFDGNHITSQPRRQEGDQDAASTFTFRYEPAVTLNLETIFGTTVHPSHQRNASTGRGNRPSLCLPNSWSQTSGSKSSSVSSCQSIKRVGKRRRKRLSLTNHYIQSESEGEELPKANKSRKSMVKFTMNPKDFDYFTNIVYSDDDKYLEPETDRSSSRMSGKVYCHEDALCLSVMELLQCILSLQAQIAAHETETKQIFSPLLACNEILVFCIETIPCMVEELKTIEFKGEDSFPIYVLLTQVLRLLFSAVQKFLKSGEWLNTVIDLQVVPKVMGLITGFLDTKFGSSPKAEISKSTFGKASVAYEGILGVIYTLLCCTCLKVEYKDVRHCLSLHKVFLENNGPLVIKKVISLNALLSVNKRADVLNLLSRLVLYMKYWREDVHHSEKCEKKSHRFCEYLSVQNHHLQVFGMSSSMVNAIDPSACMIANFVCILLDSMSYNHEADLYTFSIKALTKCGLCCCMNTGMILSRLLQMLTEKPRLVGYAASYIENVVWRDLSGLTVRDPPRCAFCQTPDFMGVSHHSVTGEYAPEESFSSTFSGRSVPSFHSPLNYNSQGYDDKGKTLSISHWEGISQYKKYLFCPQVSSKIMSHIIRLLSQSNTAVKIEICEHLIVPTLKQICDQGVDIQLEEKELNREVLIGLFKCFRLTLAESSDQKLMKFLQDHGLTLIMASKLVPGIRHEAFALLCNIVMKELKSKPGLPVLSDTDEESNFIFTKVFEREILEHDEFWTAYFNMKDREMRQRFFIHTQLSMGEAVISGSQECVNSGDDEGYKTQPDVDLPAYTNPPRATEVHPSEASDDDDDDEPVYSGRIIRQDAVDDSEVKGSCESRKTEQFSRREDFLDQYTDENFKNMDATILATKYKGLGELWVAITQVLHKSSEFQAYLAASSVRSLAAPLLINITQDLARASSGALSLHSVVLEELAVTFSLVHSLLTFIIVAYPYAGLNVETLLNELRSPLLRYSPRTCGDVKQLVSVLMQCCVLSGSSSSTFSLSHSAQHVLEVLDEDTTGPTAEPDHAEDTDGYEADTEQLANETYPTSARSSRREEDLECPELVLLALDLIINHHVKFLETKEEGSDDMKDWPKTKWEYMKPDSLKPESGDFEKSSVTSPVLTEGEVGEGMKHTDSGLETSISAKSKKETLNRTESVESNTSTSSVYHSIEDDIFDMGESGCKENLEPDAKNSVPSECSAKGKPSMQNTSSTNSYDDTSSQNSDNSQLKVQSRLPDAKSVFDNEPKVKPQRQESALIASSSVMSSSGLCCESEMSHSASLTQCVHALLVLCKSSPTICRRLHSLGFLSNLLNGFTDLIAANNITYQDLVGTVVSVWAEVGRWSITPTELSQFLALFKSKSPPLDILLRALSRVLEGCGREPQCSLTYPCPGAPTASITPTLDASHNSLTESLASFVNIRVPSSPVVEAITRLHDSHCRHGILSCAAISCVVCPVPRTLDWSPYNSGLACTSWLCIRDRSATENKLRPSSHSSLSWGSESGFNTAVRCGSFSRGATSTFSVSSELTLNKLHLLSVGTQHLMFSLWLDPTKDFLQVCVTREVDGESAVLSHGVVLHAGLCDGEWHHLAFCVPTINVRRGGSLKMAVFVDAINCHAVNLVIPAVGSIKKSTPSYLLLGHADYYSPEVNSSGQASDDDHLTFHRIRRGSLCFSHSHKLMMANTFLFREPILSRELCLYLIALGKDYLSLIPLTGKDERILLTPYISPKLLSTGIDLAVLYAKMETLIRPAQEGLLLLHTAQRPSEFLCYKPHMPSLQDTGTYYPSCTTQTAVLFGEMTPQKTLGPDVALLQMGGVAHLIYLFARVVEVQGEEREQAEALTLLLKAVHSSPQLSAEFALLRGSSLVFRILSSPLATPGVQAMKALLDGCIYPSVVQYLACRDVYTIASHVPAMLVNRDLMESLIINWKCFVGHVSEDQLTKYCVNDQGERISELGMLLAALMYLLAENQVYRDFNLVQLRDIDALDKILFMGKALQLTDDTLDGKFMAHLYVGVVTGLMGGSGPGGWKSVASGLGVKFVSLESFSSGFCSGPSASGLTTTNTGNSYGITSPPVRVRDAAAVYGFLLLSHPAHLTYAATDQNTAYYLPIVQPKKVGRPGSLVAVGVDLAAQIEEKQSPSRSDKSSVPVEVVEKREPVEAKTGAEETCTLNNHCSKSSGERGPSDKEPYGTDEKELTDKERNGKVGTKKVMCPAQVILREMISTEWIIIDNPGNVDGVRKVTKTHRSGRPPAKDESTPESSSSVSSDDADEEGVSGVKKIPVEIGEDHVDGDSLVKTSALANMVVPGVDVLEQKFDSESVEIEDAVCADQNLDESCDKVTKTLNNKHSMLKVPRLESPSADSSGSDRTEVIDKCIGKTTRWTEDVGETEEDDSDEEEESISGEELSTLMQVVVGLLELLQMILKYSNESTRYTLLAEAIYMDQAQIMMNHPHPVIRTAVFKLFTTILERCSHEDRVLHLRQHAPMVVAQQLYKHTSTSSHLVMAVFSLAHGRPFTFDDYAIDSDPSLALPGQVTMFIPLMAVLPNTCQDIALCHNSLMVLLDLLHKNPDLIVSLVTRAHLVDSLLSTLKKCLHVQGVGINDVTGESESEVVVSDVTDILSWIINSLVTSNPHKHYMICLETLHQLNLMCRGEKAECGGQANCVALLHTTEAALLQVALSRIQATASTLQHTARDMAASLISGKGLTGSSSMHNMKLFAAQTREDSDTGVGSVLANYATIPLSHSFHTISDQLFISQSRSSPSIVTERKDREKDKDKEKEPLSQGDLNERFKVLLQRAVDFVFLSAWSSVEAVACVMPSGNAVDAFSLFLLEMLLCATATITQRKGTGSCDRCGWERMVWGSQDVLRLHLTHLLALVTSPRTHTYTRIRAAQLLATHTQAKGILLYATKSNPQLMYKVGIFLHELRYKNEKKLEESDIKSCETVLEILEDCTVHVLPPPELYPPHGAMREWSVVIEEKKQWQDEAAKISNLIVERYTKMDKRLMGKNSHIFEQVAAECSRLTRTVVDRQNVERKFVLSGIKHSQCCHVHLTHRWRSLIEILCHERGTWHFSDSYPRSWQLDQTEGPMRVRKRLTRGRLHLQPRYLLDEYKQKLEKESQPTPLEAVLRGSETESAMAVLIERLNLSERIVHMSSATVISPGMEQRGEILISRTAMYFIGEQVTVDMNQCGGSSELVSVTWPLDNIREIHIRRFQLQDCALELFLTTGHSVLMAFSDSHHRNQVMGVLTSSDLPNLSSKTTLPEVTTQWREGHITNFEYLTQLNKLAGRSFNDLMQYPVFPFILSNYTSDTLYLNDPSVYRNLKKPIAVQDSAKEDHYISNYEITTTMTQDARDGPYHYGSHYSNSGIVLHFLVRLPPFTQLFLRYQDGNFDIPDRTFHSMHTSWRLASRDSTTDFKELIPEFFFLPETFLNSEGFNFGVRQSGERVHHVHLPPWCGGDPRRFVLVHRAALESSYVTQNLHNWIDLVFGYKQTGRAAVEAINVFHPATYFGYDVENGGDEISREARKAMIKTYGQTPQQLFVNPHPTVNHPGITQNPNAPEVLHEVRGLRWGTYAGSPADERPVLALVQNLKTQAAFISSISATELLLMPPHTLVLTAGVDRGSRTRISPAASYSTLPHPRLPGIAWQHLSMLYQVAPIHTPCINGVYILSSHHHDGIIRYRRHKETSAQPLITVPQYDKVMWCSSGNSQVWVGLASGQILVYLVYPGSVGGDLKPSLPPTSLLAHTAPITHMYVSEAFSVCISGGKDGMCVLWDTNRLTYIRSIGSSGVEVSLLAMSETLGDWASVSPLGSAASVLRLYTINGALVDSVVTPAPVTAITFSSAPEGTAINVIATSHADGLIRLYSVWDLRPVRELKTERARQAITCLHYTHDNHHLCGITESGTLLVWESSLVKTKMPKFITVPAV